MAEWVDAIAAGELPEGSRRVVRRAGHEIAMFFVAGRYKAIEDSCPHQGASLVTGKAEGTTVACRAHGLRFDLATGCLRGAPGMKARTYPVRRHEGRILIDLSPPDTQ